MPGRAHLVIRGLWGYRASHLAALGATAIAAAVVCGGLTIGHSVRQSLLERGRARLGRISGLISTDRTFSARWPDEITGWTLDWQAAPLMVTACAARSEATDALAPNAGIIGVDARFGAAYGAAGRALTALGPGKACISQDLATDLRLRVGDGLLVYAGGAAGVAADSLYYDRRTEKAHRSLRVEVQAILPAAGPGGFDIRGAAMRPRNAFVRLDELQDTLGEKGSANAAVFYTEPGVSAVMQAPLRRLAAETAASADLGFTVPPADATGSVAVQSAGYVLPTPLRAATERSLAAHGVVTARSSVYLADSLGVPGRRVLRYAVVAAQDGAWGLQLRATSGSPTPGPGEVVLGAWAAQETAAKPGDLVTMATLTPKPDGSYAVLKRRLRVCGIADPSGDGANPTLAPLLPGVTDAASIRDWDPPFPVDLTQVTDRDEAYWKRWKAAPKAFIHADDMKALWRDAQPAAPDDWVTSLRCKASGPEGAARIEEALRAVGLDAAGISVRDLAAESAAASQGSSDFSGLFIGLGLFIIAAGLALAAGVQRLQAIARGSDIGLMLALGVSRRAAANLVLAELAAVSSLGSAAGAGLGIAYAAGVLALLADRWQIIVGSAPVSLHVSAPLLAAGALGSLLAALVAPWRAARRLQQETPLVLLRRAHNEADTLAHRRTHRRPAQSVAGLALAGLRARRGQAALGAGLAAASSLVLAAVAANGVDARATDPSDRRSGTGGYRLMVQSAIPIAVDFGTTAGRAKLGFSPEGQAALAGAVVMRLPVSPGDDPSCLNPAKPLAPRVAGVSDAMVARGGFRVTGVAADNPWTALTQASTGPAPAFGDADTVQWILHSGQGKRFVRPSAGVGDLTLRFDGLLQASVFSGFLLVSEARFRKAWPAITAPSLFLIDLPADKADAAADAIRETLGEFGVTVKPTVQALQDVAGVRNAYLSAFLALGGLGLALGGLGLAAAVARAAAERRSELALLTACGFGRRQIAALLLWEHLGPAAAGFVLGVCLASPMVVGQTVAGSSAVDWRGLAVALASVAAVGAASCLVAALSLARRSSVRALRSE
ncbi:MAG: ABC transporter permease [Armatimonadetes bacterium]|nr:ABC transporter permease [Armatimonadota bacterium]